MFAKSRTWVVHKDRYGNTLPTAQHLSDFRKKHYNPVKKRQSLNGLKKPEKMEGFSKKNYLRETAWIVGGFIGLIGLLYYVAPEVLRYLGL